jgi:predicted ATPase
MKGFFASAILLSLLACSSHLDKPVNEVAELSRKDFMNALRWKQYKAAAEFMLPENRKDFLATFNKLKDIHITDVRLLDLQEKAEGRRFETSIEMDYYLLPSVSVKTFNFAQDWVYFAGEDSSQEGFRIITSFPDFP